MCIERGHITIYLYIDYAISPLTSVSPPTQETSKGQVRLDINRAVSFAYPSFSPYYSLFAAYGAVSFVYISALLVWPSNSLEACLSGGQGAELPSESGAPLAARPLRLYTQLNCRYKNSWNRFHYGEGPSPLSIFTVGLG